MVLLGSTQAGCKAVRGMKKTNKQTNKQTNKKENVCYAGYTNTTPCASKLTFTTACTMIKTRVVIVSAI